ncbi:MAG: type II secretion system F family protein, partial [Chloroflexi bacterium]|nr:type II secretion system F family protein [Chloroflexota bacterium]
LQRALIPGLRRFGRVGRRMTPASVTERLAKDLVYAGSPVGWDAERVLALKLLSVGVLVGFAFLLGRLAGFTPFRISIFAGLFGFVGYYLPEWILRSKAGTRQRLMQRALPDALDLLSITVEAGLGFDAAVARVARQSGGPLGEELHRVLQEMQIGKSRSDALRDLADRTSIAELKSFVLAMVQADIFGISIAKVLQVQAREMRLKRRQRAEEQAQKVPVKIVFPLILCIFPSLFIVLLGPAVITIYENILSNTPGG